MDIKVTVSSIITDKKAESIVKDLDEMEGISAKLVRTGLMNREYHISIDTSKEPVSNESLVALGCMIATKECLN